MRTIIGALLLAALAAPAGAQDPTGSEEYCFTGTLAQARRVNVSRAVHNEQTCAAAGLALDCTQGDLTTAEAPGTIYDNSLAGRTLFIAVEVLVPWFQAILAEQLNWNRERARLNWCAASQTDKDAACTSAGIGLEAGCQLYSCN